MRMGVTCYSWTSPASRQCDRMPGKTKEEAFTLAQLQRWWSRVSQPLAVVCAGWTWSGENIEW